MWRAYLELVRPANVVTSLADVLAGFAVSGLNSPAALPWLLTASASLYAGGVVLNDVFDRHLDQAERPERPIPSGRVGARQAAWLGGALLVIGTFAASRASTTGAALAGVIAVSVLLYDAVTKRYPVLGPATMGCCRAFNLLLGVAAVPAAVSVSWPLALIPFAYISGVTALSRGEVSGGRRRTATAALVLVSSALASLAWMARSSAAAALLTLALAWRLLPAFWAAYRHLDAHRVRQAVRRGVLSLVLLDAAVAAAYGHVGYSLAVLAIGLLAAWLARSFAVT